MEGEARGVQRVDVLLRGGRCERQGEVERRREHVRLEVREDELARGELERACERGEDGLRRALLVRALRALRALLVRGAGAGRAGQHACSVSEDALFLFGQPFLVEKGCTGRRGISKKIEKSEEAFRKKCKTQNKNKNDPSWKKWLFAEKTRNTRRRVRVKRESYSFDAFRLLINERRAEVCLIAARRGRARRAARGTRACACCGRHGRIYEQALAHVFALDGLVGGFFHADVPGRVGVLEHDVLHAAAAPVALPDEAHGVAVDAQVGAELAEDGAQGPVRVHLDDGLVEVAGVPEGEGLHPAVVAGGVEAGLGRVGLALAGRRDEAREADGPCALVEAPAGGVDVGAQGRGNAGEREESVERGKAVLHFVGALHTHRRTQMLWQRHTLVAVQVDKAWHAHSRARAVDLDLLQRVAWRHVRVVSNCRVGFLYAVVALGKWLFGKEK